MKKKLFIIFLVIFMSLTAINSVRAQTWENVEGWELYINENTEWENAETWNIYINTLTENIQENKAFFTLCRLYDDDSNNIGEYNTFQGSTKEISEDFSYLNLFVEFDDSNIDYQDLEVFVKTFYDNTLSLIESKEKFYYYYGGSDNTVQFRFFENEIGLENQENRVYQLDLELLEESGGEKKIYDNGYIHIDSKLEVYLESWKNVNLWNIFINKGIIWENVETWSLNLLVKKWENVNTWELFLEVVREWRNINEWFLELDSTVEGWEINPQTIVNIIKWFLILFFIPLIFGY